MGKPKIRFKGFTDDWEQRKLDDVVEFLDTMRKPLEGAKRITGPYPYYGASGIVDYVEGYLFDEELILLSEDGANITDRNYPVCFLASGKYWVNNHAHVLRTKKENENNFICNSLERKDYTPLNTGMAMPKLNKETCKRIPLDCPSFEEQKKIGDYFRKFDHLITLHQRKCDEVKTLKKYMLQKMFPQNGMNVPEIRFSGFTDVWEQRKLGEVAEKVYGGGTPKTSEEEFWGGNIPWFQSADLHEHEVQLAIPKKAITALGLQKSAAQLVPGNSIAIVTRVGVGKLVFMPFSYATSQDFLSLSELNIDGKFGCYAIYRLLQREKNLTQGTSIKGITKDEILQKKIVVPNKIEQKKIGDYFTGLDNLITLHQRKCNELRKMKKFMLQNMFPKD